MFVVNEDKSIYLTRGDVGAIEVSATAPEGGAYVFTAGEVVRLKVFGKKNCDNVVLQKDVQVGEDTETIIISLQKDETKFEDYISKPKDYWYEIELNPDTAPQTIIGYDEDGAKVFRLYPEGGDDYE
jgi:hypothetical protein